MKSSEVPLSESEKSRTNNQFISIQKPLLIVENFQLLRSNIHGIGLFATKTFSKGSEMGVAFVSEALSFLYEEYLGDNYDENADDRYRQLSAVRYINHSLTPNIGFYKPEKNLIFARCLQDIRLGDEIVADYNLAFPLFDEAIPAWVNA